MRGCRAGVGVADLHISAPMFKFTSHTPSLAGPRTRNLAAWLSGWFNLLGQVGSTAGVAYTSAGGSLHTAGFAYCAGGCLRGVVVPTTMTLWRTVLYGMAANDSET